MLQPTNPFKERAEKSNSPDAARMMGFKIIRSPYSRVRHEFAKLGQSDTILKQALKMGHGIDPENLDDETMLHFVVSEQQMDSLKAGEIEGSACGMKLDDGRGPTLLQVLGTSEVIALDAEQAQAKFLKLKG